jgi:hypothetical protein
MTGVWYSTEINGYAVALYPQRRGYIARVLTVPELVVQAGSYQAALAALTCELNLHLFPTLA